MAAVHRHVPKFPDGYERWICVYPGYINKDRTLAEGRRIPKEKCVSQPTFEEMMDVLSTTGLQIVGERKIYCREKSKDGPNLGRVRVQLKSTTGENLHNTLKTRHDVFSFLGTQIPQLKSRTNPRPAQDSQSQQGNKGKGKKKK